MKKELGELIDGLLKEVRKRSLEISAQALEVRHSEGTNGPPCVEVNTSTVDDLAARVLVGRGVLRRFAGAKRSFVLTERGEEILTALPTGQTPVGL